MNWTERDQKVIWHPYTQMQTAAPPIAIVRGEAALLFDDQNNAYLDAVSSWWVNIHGHAHPYIAKKVSEQLGTLEHVIFAGFTHPTAIQLAEGLLAILPENQQKVFYSDNGSTAVEVALKMCMQFWSNQGKARTKVVALKNAYHGDTFGAMSVSARSVFTASFDPYLFEVEFIDLPNEENIDSIKQQLSAIGHQLSAFIFEPLVQGSAGMLMYEARYLDELMAHCREENILTIADEVMTGFGRTGKRFACDYLQQKPDLMCFSKGLTGGTMALGITTCTNEIFNAFLSDDKYKTLFHGHSFTANPVACAAALASLDLFLKPETTENIERICKRHQLFADKNSIHPRLKAMRQTGTILAMEFNTEAGTSYFNSLRDQLYQFFIAKGIILRPLGNIIYFLTPYCITNEQLDQLYKAVEDALEIF